MQVAVCIGSDSSSYIQRIGFSLSFHPQRTSSWNNSMTSRMAGGWLVDFCRLIIFVFYLFDF